MELAIASGVSEDEISRMQSMQFQAQLTAMQAHLNNKYAVELEYLRAELAAKTEQKVLEAAEESKDKIQTRRIDQNIDYAIKRRRKEHQLRMELIAEIRDLEEQASKHPSDNNLKRLLESKQAEYDGLV